MVEPLERCNAPRWGETKMKYAVCVIACVGALTACNKGPEVNLKNATGNEVAQAVRQSGVMSSDTMVEPGLWQSKVTIQEMKIPGIPAQYADRMKQEMAAHQQQTSKRCLTKEEAKKPKEDFFAGQDKSCRYGHFTMGGGKIDIQMVCTAEGHTQTTNMAGSYTPTNYAMDMSSQGSSGAGNMSMKMHVDAQRVGECTGKDS
jgi:hypothetical protein